MTGNRLELAADKLEIIDLSSNYMRGLDRLDAELQRSVFWDDAYLDYGTCEGATSIATNNARVPGRSPIAVNWLTGCARKPPLMTGSGAQK